jgi:hypothetical protein
MTTNFRGGVFSSHKPYRRLPRASGNPRHQKNSPIYLELSIPQKSGNSYFLQGQISPEPPGTSKQSLVRPLGSLEVTNYSKKYYNQERKEESLLPLEPIIKEKSWIIYSKDTNNAQKRGEIEASKKVIEEFRRKLGFIPQESKVMEIPKVDRNRFEYITKKL